MEKEEIKRVEGETEKSEIERRERHGEEWNRENTEKWES